MAKKILGFRSSGPNKSPYLGFFSQSKNAIIRSASYGIHHPVGNLKISNQLKDFNRGKLRDVGYIPEKGPGKGLTQIKGDQFAQHLNILSNQFDIATWMFIQALGSHMLQWFQSSFKNKGLTTDRWKALSDTTRRKRVKLGFSAIDTLVRTGRLRDSLEMYPLPGGKSVKILTKPNAFRGAYPEFIGSHRRKTIYNGNVGRSGFSVNGRQLWGRLGRIYAGCHLNKDNERMYRPFMTEDIRGNEKKKIIILMDDILFYGVFNRVMGFSIYKG